MSDFRFELPERLIAARPAEPRDAARMFVFDRRTGAREHRRVADLPEYVGPRDLLVLNDTRVLPNRLIGRRETGGRVEVLILERDGETCRGYAKPARKIHPGRRVELEDGALVFEALESLGGGQFRFRLSAADGRAVGAVLEEVGRAPLPPYIERGDDEDPAADRERYQTVYAAVDGAVAAPTAGLHFTSAIFERLAAAGVERTAVTLHVGEGTFAPVRVDDVASHEMHSESYELGAETAARIAATRDRGGRVLAVGTTSARVLETCAVGEDGLVEAASGSTQLFLYPGRPLRVVDGLLTNFHLPESTLIMLVAAFVGRETVLDLYREAVEREYRFYSYGDAMLLL